MLEFESHYTQKLAGQHTDKEKSEQNMMCSITTEAECV